MKNISLRRGIKGLIIAGLGIYLVWLGFQAVKFSFPDLSSSDFSNQAVGVYHVHSHFSDGKKDLESIAGAAAQCGLDFLILTDHGNLNRDSLQVSGNRSGVLLLGGSELSLNRGHLVALNLQPPFNPLSGKAEQAALQIRQNQGISIIAHPYSKNRWSWGKENSFYSGMEIINADSMLKSGLPGLIPYLPLLMLNPRVVALKMLHCPEANLAKWDDFNRSRPFYGYYAADAHMFYRALFSLLRLHVPLENGLSSEPREAAVQIYSALSEGRFYNGIDGAADTSGFRFWGETDKRRIPMGSSAPLTPDTILCIDLPPGQIRTVRLVHNGNSLTLSPVKHIRFRPEEPGFYRVEVYLHKSLLSQDCPWILSNPIYLKEKCP